MFYVAATVKMFLNINKWLLINVNSTDRHNTNKNAPSCRIESPFIQLCSLSSGNTNQTDKTGYQSNQSRYARRFSTGMMMQMIVYGQKGDKRQHRKQLPFD
jgi:hypothetical protein